MDLTRVALHRKSRKWRTDMLKLKAAAAETRTRLLSPQCAAQRAMGVGRRRGWIESPTHGITRDERSREEGSKHVQALSTSLHPYYNIYTRVELGCGPQLQGLSRSPRVSFPSPSLPLVGKPPLSPESARRLWVALESQCSCEFDLDSATRYCCYSRVARGK